MTTSRPVNKCSWLTNPISRKHFFKTFFKFLSKCFMIYRKHWRSLSSPLLENSNLKSKLCIVTCIQKDKEFKLQLIFQLFWFVFVLARSLASGCGRLMVILVEGHHLFASDGGNGKRNLTTMAHFLSLNILFWLWNGWK